MNKISATFWIALEKIFYFLGVPLVIGGLLVLMWVLFMLIESFYVDITTSVDDTAKTIVANELNFPNEKIKILKSYTENNNKVFVVNAGNATCTLSMLKDDNSHKWRKESLDCLGTLY